MQAGVRSGVCEKVMFSWWMVGGTYCAGFWQSEPEKYLNNVTSR